MSDRAYEEIHSLRVRPDGFHRDATMRWAHVSGARTLDGLLIGGDGVRLTLTNANGPSVTVLFCDEQWGRQCDDFKAILDRPTEPDTTARS